MWRPKQNTRTKYRRVSLATSMTTKELVSIKDYRFPFLTCQAIGFV